MKKFPTSFAAIVMILAIMFFMLSSFMKHAEKDLKNLYIITEAQCVAPQKAGEI